MKPVGDGSGEDPTRSPPNPALSYQGLRTAAAAEWLKKGRIVVDSGLRLCIEEETMTKALLIEPKDSVRQRIAKVLRKRGMAVYFAEKPSEAADVLRTSAADVVLLDVDLSGGGAFELLKKLRVSAPALPIILLTRHSRSGAVNEAKRLGASILSTEPLDVEELLDRVRNALVHTGDIGEFTGKQVRNALVHTGDIGEFTGKQVVESLTGHMVRELHDPVTGRLDAKRIADYLAVPLSSLAHAIEKNTATVHKSPAAISSQDSLAPIARTIGTLMFLLRSRDQVLAWMNSPHPDLGGRTPLNLVLAGKATTVAELLEAALAGQPS